MQQNQAEKIFLFSTKRNITNLFKEFLFVIENLKDQHDDAMGKLIDALPNDQKSKVILANHFTEQEMDRIRKKILGSGNDCYRSIEEQSKNFKIDFF
jgi:hypothetical protein